MPNTYAALLKAAVARLGEGEAGMRGGPAGDLYIFLSVKPHSIFERDGMLLSVGPEIQRRNFHAAS